MSQPPAIPDLWETRKVCQLQQGDIICVLGRELIVEYCVIAERGGDFYVLEAYGDHGHPDIVIQDVVSFTLDKNTKVFTR